MASKKKSENNQNLSQAKVLSIFFIIFTTNKQTDVSTIHKIRLSVNYNKENRAENNIFFLHYIIATKFKNKERFFSGKQKPISK